MPDRLSALDAAFLHLERPHEHMHIGAVATFEGPPPGFTELLARIDRRLHLVPRYRRRLGHGPLNAVRPLWVDDPAFRIANHVRHTALRSPGGRAELMELVGRSFSTQLDRRRPLWELWFVEGLATGGFALIFKAHHALIDGLAGVSLATAVLDAEREGDANIDGAEWAATPPPGPRELIALGAMDAACAGVAISRVALAAARRPEHALAGARGALAAVGELARDLANPAPATPLGVPIGPDRRLATVSFPLDAVRQARDRAGASVNDVLLCAVAGMLRRFLVARDVAVDGLVLQALVPVSTRGGSPGSIALGNEVSAVRAPLPVQIADPLERLEAVRRAMSDVKGSGQARGAVLLVAAGELVPAPLLAWAGRLRQTTRLVNLLVTNIPGPAAPLFLLGRELQEAYPVALLPRDHALAVAILSYNGTLAVGLLADPDALPELDTLAAWLGEEIAALAV